MGRLTQIVDYLNRYPEDFYKEIGDMKYTHITIDENMKATRRRLKLYQTRRVMMTLLLRIKGALPF